MTAAAIPGRSTPARSEPARSEPARAGLMPWPWTVRLLWLELRRSPMLWLVPLAVALFWFDTYRSALTFTAPPLWSVRTFFLEKGNAVVDFAPLVAGVAAWAGSRDGRRRTTDLVTVTARPRWAVQLVSWAACTCWAVAAYLGCVGVLYGVIGQQAAWGGPPLWPVVVGAASVLAASALGFAAGTAFRSRFTAGLAAFGMLLALLAGQAATGRYGLISPVQAGRGIGTGAGIFYHYLPDVSIAQVVFLAGLAAAALGAVGLPAVSGGRPLRAAAAAVTAIGLVAAGTAAGLAGTARLAVNGWAIPALHDAASDRPVPYIAVCSRGVVPVCVHPAYRGYLPDLAASLSPLLSQLAGLPGAPVRVIPAVTSYLDQTTTRLDEASSGGPAVSGRPPVLSLPLGNAALPGEFGWTTGDFIGQIRVEAAPVIVASVIGGPSGRLGSPAQQAVAAALAKTAGLPSLAPAGGQRTSTPSDPAVHAAARRFAAQPAAARHGWLVTHLAALRAGDVTLRELP